ncbi:MAG: transcriptional regulator [Candidatus Thermoplasmatota archaeon]|nr:transcriptional regulator [Candidatus Thermoplasmatota archaeon]
MNPADRTNLIDAVSAALANSGFSVSERCDMRPLCFDLIAGRDDSILVIKVLANADALDEDAAQKMIKLAMSIKGAPIVVAMRTSTDALEDDVVYLRSNVPVITFNTLSEYIINEQRPIAYAGPGGLYAEIDSKRLRELREIHNLSLSSLANMLGVSRRTISMYESGMNMLVEVAAQLEETFGGEFIRPLEVFSTGFMESSMRDAIRQIRSHISEDVCNDDEKYVIDSLVGMGCDVIHVKKAPFDAIVQNAPANLNAIAGIGGADEASLRKARMMKSIAEVADVPPVMFSPFPGVRKMAGLPVISFSELELISAPEEILELILERS